MTTPAVGDKLLGLCLVHGEVREGRAQQNLSPQVLGTVARHPGGCAQLWAGSKTDNSKVTQIDVKAPRRFLQPGYTELEGLLYLSFFFFPQDFICF